MQRRGPDFTRRIVLGGLEFVHNLLQLTGPRTPQPLVEPGDGAAVVFNGEIYNHGRLAEELGVPAGASDGAVLLPAYRRWGVPRFVRQLDGEFAMVIADFIGGQLVLVTDAFGTKPLWLALGRNRTWAVASYRSALLGIGMQEHETHMLAPNTILTCRLPALDGCKRRRGVRFDMRQFKNSTADWREAFSRAVAKRAEQGLNGPRSSVFIGLSSGHDSGAIHSELLLQMRHHAAYSILGPESAAILRARAELARAVSGSQEWASTAILGLTSAQWWWEKAWLATFAEPHEEPEAQEVLSSVQLWEEDGRCTKSADDEDGEMGVSISVFSAAEALSGADTIEERYRALDNPSSIGTSVICREAAAAGHRVMLSGQGADETMTNYGDRGRPLRDHLGRIFAREDAVVGVSYPEDLSEVFPWNNFFRGAQRTFMHTIEVACGAHGVEARYPFLDLRVVQEWLWLTPSAKHAAYKAPIEEFLSDVGYPYLPGKKAGFGAKEGVDESQWRGRAWEFGKALGRSAAADELPPPFSVSSGQPPQSSTECSSEMCDQHSEPELLCRRSDTAGNGMLLRGVWLKAASYGHVDVVGTLLGRCCYRPLAAEEESGGDCAVTLLNTRELSGVTALRSAALRGDAEMVQVLQQLACWLPQGAHRTAALAGQYSHEELAAEFGTKGVDALWPLLPGQSPNCSEGGEATPIPTADAPLEPLIGFMETMFQTMVKHDLLGPEEAEDAVRELVTLLDS